MKVPLLIIGGGLSGLAAALRTSRFIPEVLVLEQHSRLGGLNSYFYRNGHLFETGLHAITNFAAAGDKQAPLNRLLRQLKLRRDDLSVCQQLQSEIVFEGIARLRFSNDRRILFDSVHSLFPKRLTNFSRLIKTVEGFDPFRPAPYRSARAIVSEILDDDFLAEMLFCPLMFYGSSREKDMDFGQFVIMFRSIFLEGLFRPAGSVKDLLDLLHSQLLQTGATVRTRSTVAKLLTQKKRVVGAELMDGTIIECDYILSTIGHLETLRLLGSDFPDDSESTSRLTFVETIFQVQPLQVSSQERKTIVFYNQGELFNYRNPTEDVDYSSGVICFPNHFEDLPERPLHEIRTTHLANYHQWKALAATPDQYQQNKLLAARRSKEVVANLLGSFPEDIVYQNTFTPVTIERFTAKLGGAVYGSPDKHPDGRTAFENLFLAGTDQGFLGIIGSMLSGVSMVNQHILPKI